MFDSYSLYYFAKIKSRYFFAMQCTTGLKLYYNIDYLTVDEQFLQDSCDFDDIRHLLIILSFIQYKK